MDEYSANGKTIPHAFSNGNNVGLDTMMLKSKKLTTTSVARLHFVCNKNNIVLFAFVGDELKELGGRFIQTSYSLDGFQYYSAVLIGSYCFFKSLRIVQGQESNFLLFVDWRIDTRIVRSSNCS